MRHHRPGGRRYLAHAFTGQSGPAVSRLFHDFLLCHLFSALFGNAFRRWRSEDGRYAEPLDADLGDILCHALVALSVGGGAARLAELEEGAWAGRALSFGGGFLPGRDQPLWRRWLQPPFRVGRLLGAPGLFRCREPPAALPLLYRLLCWYHVVYLPDRAALRPMARQGLPRWRGGRAQRVVAEVLWLWDDPAPVGLSLSGPVWVSSFSIVLLGLHQVTTGVLQGLGHPTIPMINMVIAAIAKVILNWVLTAQPSLGIMGAAWATVADIGIAALINLYFLYKYINYKIEIMQLLKTIVSAAIMAGIIHFGYEFLLYETASNALATFASLFVGMFFYIIVLILIGGIMESDIERIPMIGAPSIRFFKKIGVLKN